MPIRIRLSILMPIQVRIYTKVLHSLEKREIFWLFFSAMPAYIVYLSHQCRRCHILDSKLKLLEKSVVYLYIWLKMDPEPVGPGPWFNCPEAEFLDEIQTKVLRVFLLAITVSSTALPWDFCFFRLTQPLTVFYSSVTVHCKGERRKIWKKRKPYPLPYGLRNPYRNLKSENSLRLCPETSTKLNIHEFDFWSWESVYFAGMWRPNSTHAPVPRCAGYRVPALRQHIQQEMHAQQTHRTGIGIAFFLSCFYSSNVHNLTYYRLEP
jgi:hypothetical protein